MTHATKFWQFPGAAAEFILHLLKWNYLEGEQNMQIVANKSGTSVEKFAQDLH